MVMIRSMNFHTHQDPDFIWEKLRNIMVETRASSEAVSLPAFNPSPVPEATGYRVSIIIEEESEQV